jgi:hypothetical protein
MVDSSRWIIRRPHFDRVSADYRRSAGSTTPTRSIPTDNCRLPTSGRRPARPARARNSFPTMTTHADSSGLIPMSGLRGRRDPRSRHHSTRTPGGPAFDGPMLQCPVFALRPERLARLEIIDRNNPIVRENRPATAFLTLRREARQQSCASYTPHLGCDNLT